jgi:hypothetical protein
VIAAHDADDLAGVEEARRLRVNPGVDLLRELVDARERLLTFSASALPFSLALTMPSDSGSMWMPAS